MADTDAAGLIYFASPYRWAEEMFTGWLHQLGHPISRMLADGTATPAVATRSRYSSPLTMDDAVELELRTRHVGGSSFSVDCEVRRQPDGALAASVTVCHMYGELRPSPDGRRTFRPRPVPLWLQEALLSPAPVAPTGPDGFQGGAE